MGGSLVPKVNLKVYAAIMEKNNDIEDGEESLKEDEVTKTVSLHTTELKEKNIISKSCRPSLDDIAEECSQVSCSTAKDESTGQVCSMTITVDEAFCHLRSSDLPSVENYCNGPDRLRWSHMFHWLRAPPKLDTALKPEYDLVLSIAQSSFNWLDTVHWRMIQTVFKRLTGANEDCAKYGAHWQLIGFQGSDPSTDLRGVGMLGLVHMLYLATHANTQPLGLKLYSVSNSKTQPFPLAVLSLNVTSIAVNALRAGRLNKECNSRHSVFDVVNLFYTVIINYIYVVWTEQNKTLKDSGILLKGPENWLWKRPITRLTKEIIFGTLEIFDAERFCNKHVRRLLRELPSALSKYK